MWKIANFAKRYYILSTIRIPTIKIEIHYETRKAGHKKGNVDMGSYAIRAVRGGVCPEESGFQ